MERSIGCITDAFGSAATHTGLLVNRSRKLPIHTLLFFLGVRGVGGGGGASMASADA